MGNWDWKWIFVGMILVGGYMYYDKSSKSDLSNTLQERGVAVNGLIIDGHEQTRRKGGTSYYLVVQYKPEGLGLQKTKLEVSSSLYGRVAKNMPVEVLYLKEEPTQFMIKGEPLASEDEATIALVILAIGMAGGGWFGVDHVMNARKSAA